MEIDRRKFLNLGGVAMATLAFSKTLRAQACTQATTADRYGYGPFYLENAPARTQLAAPGEPGQPLTLQGQVADCDGPLAGVIVEAWHATDAGCYIHPQQPACDDRGDAETTRLWTRLVTDAEGRFGFSTIKPGVYLNGSTYRPSHIHFRIRKPGPGGEPIEDLVTQLYFQGDPYIPGDYGADDPGAASRIIALSETAGNLSGEFPIVLPKTVAGLGHRSDPLGDPALRAFDVFVRRSGDRLLVFLPPLPDGEPVSVRVFDPAGCLASDRVHAVSPIELKTDRWARGPYLAEFRWRTAKGLRREALVLRRG